MDYLNLHTSILDSDEFLGQPPVDRATWINLLRYCIGQENGGRIVGATEWGDRKWQQVVRVTRREVTRKCPLWSFDGSDLIVWQYPIQKEAEVKQKREAGRLGGAATSTAKAEAVRSNGAMGGRPRNQSEQPAQNQSTQPSENQSENLSTGSPNNLSTNQSETKAEPNQEPNGKEEEGKGTEIPPARVIDANSRAVATMGAYPDFSQIDHHPTGKGASQLSALKLAIERNPDHPWEEHAALVAEINPSPLGFGKWVQKGADSIELDHLRRVREEMNKQFPEDSLEYEAALYLWKMVTAWTNGQAKAPNLHAWAKDCAEIFGEDGRTQTEFGSLVKWLDKERPRSGKPHRDFIRNPRELRKKWNEGRLNEWPGVKVAA